MLESHPSLGIGLKQIEEKRDERWRYVNSCICPASEAVHVKIEKKKFIKLVAREQLVSKFPAFPTEGTEVLFVRTLKKAHTTITKAVTGQ